MALFYGSKKMPIGKILSLITAVRTRVAVYRAAQRTAAVVTAQRAGKQALVLGEAQRLRIARNKLQTVSRRADVEVISGQRVGRGRQTTRKIKRRRLDDTGERLEFEFQSRRARGEVDFEQEIELERDEEKEVREYVSSSNVLYVKHTFLSLLPNERTAILEVGFVNGRSYKYFGVPRDIYHRLVNARSKGRSFWRNVRRVLYPYRRIV